MSAVFGVEAVIVLRPDVFGALKSIFKF
jgi:hypothetical protein